MYRRAPESHKRFTVAARMLLVQGFLALDWRLYFRHRQPYIGLWTAAAKGGHWWSDSNIRSPSRQALQRMLESKDHWQIQDSSGV